MKNQIQVLKNFLKKQKNSKYQIIEKNLEKLE